MTPGPYSLVFDPTTLVPGNTAALLRNGQEVFPAWLSAIGNAQQRVSLEMYIFKDDVIGHQVGESLIAAARRGVDVRLMYDDVGCREAPPEFFDRLRRSGVRAIPYHRFRFWRPQFWALFRRNHRKTLVVDGLVGFTGGLNIADDWLPTAQGGGGWRDAVVELRGPVVLDLESVFLRTWNRRATKRLKLDATTLPRPAPTGTAHVSILANTELRDRFTIRRAAVHALRESRTRAYLANPYFVPDPGFLSALRAAVTRGVDVRLLVPIESDSLILDYAARATFQRLLENGVRIFQHSAVVHTKALVIDDQFVSMGSYNLDHRSLAYNLELVANVVDTEFAAQVTQMLTDDMAGSDEITVANFAERSLFTQILERLAYSLRRWL